MIRTPALPYFDILLSEIANHKGDITTAFGRHVHWGYWDETSPPDGSMRDFDEAAERMSRRVCDAGSAGRGQRVLDVGCGFGGTVASLNARFSGMDLVGLNIDPRQLERARMEVRARGDNRVEFVEGDACALPFPEASFDLVLAVECAFHFQSRARFLAEVRRVLRPGGRLAICDLVPHDRALPALLAQRLFFRGYAERVAGHTDLTYTLTRYRDEARRAGLSSLVEEDVTRNTLPTYPVLRHVIRQSPVPKLTAIWGTGAMEGLGRLGILRYVIASYAKPGERRAARDEASQTEPISPPIA